MATLKTSHREHEITRDDAYWIREALEQFKRPGPDGYLPHALTDPRIRERFSKLLSIFEFAGIEE